MGVFTGAWSILGLVWAVLPLQITSYALVAAALYFLIRGTQAGSTAGRDVAGPHRGRQLSTPSDSRFVVAVVTETVVITAMVLLMLQLKLPRHVVPLLAVIVGAHFFIFIRPGNRAVHLIAGTAGVVVGLAGIALIASATMEPVVARGIVGCCCALITAYYGCYFLSWRFTATEHEETGR